MTEINPPTIKLIRQLLVVILISINLKISLGNINPFRNPNICGSPQCDTLHNKLSFKDRIYKYEYNIDLITEFSGTGGNASSLFIKAILDVFFPKPCEGFLRINDVKLWDTQVNQKKNDITNNNDIEAINSNEDDYYGEFSDSTISGETRDDNDDIHPKSFEMARDLKEHILRFSFDDGLITEVCPSIKESVWALNFKKGILSAFQNTMSRFDVDFNTTETDTSGECNVKYSLEDTNDVFIKIRKIKDITSCRNRYSTSSILQTTPYNFRDDKTIWPILDSKSYCNMTINNNLYHEIICYDQHQLIPFSNSNSGAITRVISKFVLLEEKNYNIGEFLAENDEIVQKRSTLIFDHTPSIKPTHSEIKLARDLLKEICVLGFPNIKYEFINVFTNFLRTIKQLDYAALTQLLSRSTSICEKGKNHVLDALPYIGSTASYQLMRDLLLTDSVSKKIAVNWLRTLSFIQRPDEDTVETFYTILEFSRSKAEPEYTLSASAVIHSYCRYNADCGQNMRVKWIIESLESDFIQIFNTFRGELRLYKRMVAILKGLGNIGILSEHFVKQLKKIITENFSPLSIRLEAIFTFRRSNCEKYRSLFLNVYENFTINSEVRIAAYLQAMICPDNFSINKIKNVLKTEEINQVGSFVWSHLTNLAKSSSPVNIAVQSLLLNDDISTKFKLDTRKFSRNYQHTLFFDKYNSGTTTDMNIIFGTESYLPRMATLNLTTYLFGHSVNIFEITVRAEGFEQLFFSNLSPERFFKQYSSFNQKGLKPLIDIIYNWLIKNNTDNNAASESSTNTGSQFIHKSAVKQKPLENHTMSHDNCGFKKRFSNDSLSIKDVNDRKTLFHKGIENLGYTLKYDYNNPVFQFGTRIFGNDLHYYSLSGIPEYAELIKNLDVFQQLSEILSGKETSYTKSKVFLEASYVIPLAVGLPLSIDLFGASSIDLRTSCKLDHKNPASSDLNFDIKGMLKPTILVDVVGSMSSDLLHVRSGVKVKSTLYSNFEVAGELKVRGKRLVTFSFSLPQNTTEMLTVRSELLKISPSADEFQTGIKSRRSNSTCTWPLLETAIALKVCLDYSVPNLNNSKNTIYPGLLLSGPMNFSIALAKSDLTAKNWMFQYTSDQGRNGSKWAVLFFTPGSSFERSITANVITQPEILNASLLFVHGLSKASAMCQFIGTNMYRRFDFLLDTNGNRSLDLSVELKRQQDRNILVYKPKMLFAINGVNITGAVGTVRIYVKSGIVQNDMDFSFETRKLQMLIRGLITQSEVTKSANITVNYRFQANKIESINFQGRLTSSGDKSKVEYDGNMKLKTSTHPNLNFASNITWRSLQGHTEGIIAFNRGQDVGDSEATSILHLVLSRFRSEEKIWDDSRLYASLDVKIPHNNIDYKLFLKHEERYKNGSEHNVIVGGQINPGKEASVLFSILVPRHSLIAFDVFFNVSVTNFNSCSGRLKFVEKLPKTYLINFNGTWFTEQYIVIKSNYKDYSTRLQMLKMIVESGSFETITLNASYRRVQAFTYSNLLVKYGEDPYSLVIQLNSQPDNIKSSICDIRLQLKEQVYWLNTSLLVKQPLMLQVEIHLDKWRDIYIKSIVVHLDTQKELSFELNWDRNRDPSHRLILTADYKQNLNMEQSGQVLVTYPDRTVSFNFNVYSRDSESFGDMYVSWDINELVNIKYNLNRIPGNNVNTRIYIEIYTPFQGWHKNRLEAGVYSFSTLFLANTSLLWGENQKMELMCKSDINIDEIPLTFALRFGLNSSFVEMPSVNMDINHWHDLNKFTTDFSLLYNSGNERLKIYSWKSVWEVNKNRQYKNISGTISVLSPHKEFWKGGLVTKFCFNDRKQILGAALLTFNLREITFAMDGYINKFNDNMITINITTPLNKFRKINGRFGLIEKERHAVAQISTPITALGIEIVFDIKTITDFDIKFSVATPIENLKHMALFTKLKRDTADMRCIMNNITVGFIGTWFTNDLTDFEYSCKVFTTLKDAEYNGVVLKFLNKDLFVLNLHSKLSRYSCGIQISGKTKSPILKQLGDKVIELESKYDDDFIPPKMEDSEYSNLENMEQENFFSYNIEFLLDLLVWPTVEGMVDIEEVFDYYFTTANIKLPQGYVDIKNNLFFPDYLNLINVLNIETTFEALKEIKLIVKHHADINLQNLYEKVYCTVHNFTKGAGFEVSYSNAINDVKTPEHHLKLKLSLPSDGEIDIKGKMYLEDTLFQGYIETNAGNTCLSLAAAFETEIDLLEVSLDISVEKDRASLYASKAHFKQEFSKLHNYFDIKLEIRNTTDINLFQMEYTCHSDNEEITSNGKIITTMPSLKTFEYSLLLNKGKNPIVNIDLRFTHQSGNRMDYGIRALKRNEVFNTEIWTPIPSFRNISVHGTLIPLNSNQYRFEGVLYRDMITYNLNGVVYIDDIYLKKARLQTYLMSGKPNGLIEIDFIKNDDKESDFDFYFNAIENAEYCKISGGYSYNNLTGLDLSMLVQSTVSAIDGIHIMGSYHFTKDDSTMAKLTLKTPWRHKAVNLWSQIKRRSDQGKIHGGYKFDNHTGYGNCEWSWKPEENMRVLIESNIDRPDANSIFVFTELKYVNPNISFRDLDIGGKLNISSLLNFEVNASINYESIDSIQVGIRTYWPSRKHEIHELKGRYSGNLISKQDKNLEVFVEGKYSAKLSKRWCLARFMYTNLTNIRSMGLVEWNLTDKTSTFQADVEMSMVAKARREFLAKFTTPKFDNEATLLFIGSYDRIKGNHSHLNWSIHYPSTKRIADLDLSIQSFANLKAVLNCATPFLETPWLKADLNFTTHGLATYRFCRVDWPKDFAFMKLISTKSNDKFNTMLEGNIELEVPLNTRHRGCIKYRLNETPKLDKGSINVNYNEKLVVNGTYQREVQNFDILKETTDIIIDNIFKPIGIHFINSSDMRNSDKIFSVRHIELFDLYNTKLINLTCELYAITSEAEKEVKWVAIHPTRTVVLTTSFKTPNAQTTNHRGKLELSKTAWIEYNLVIGNNNTDNNKIRNFVANLSYPKRSISINGSYLTTLNAFNSNVSFVWSEGDNENKKAVWTSLFCQTEALKPEDHDNKTVILVIGHRLLERDIKLQGSCYRGIKELLRLNILIVYSYEMDHLVVINALLKDLRDGLGLKKYSLEFVTYHKASELDVQFNGSATSRTSYLKIQTKSLYRRDYFPEKHGLFLVLLDSKNKEMEYMRISPYRTLRIWMKPNSNYPVYGVNATLWSTPAVNNSGYIYVDMLQKEAHMYFNLTEDGSHNLIMFGCIPDSRNNYIKIWRNYEEISVVDVSSYIKFNHSRHLSGSLHWRPKIKSELKEKIISIREALLNSLTEQIDFWTKTLHIETLSAVTVVWETAREYNQDFINELSQLRVLKEDLEDLRAFMNKSYESNDFYIKTFVNFTYTMLDEIALRDHVDSLPIVFREIGQFLGDSVKALSSSIVQIIEMIKSSYNKIMQGINNFFYGESLKYLTDFMEKGFEKYEKFVKDLHISFIHHIEIFWSKFSNAISAYFKGVLKRIEPHVFEAMSFIEKIMWDLSKEVFNFIYERTNELAESTYFNQISSFTQDVENLYKDIKSHDIIFNTKKYASIVWIFLKEKYYKVIPFGSELNEVIYEIWHEIKELGKIKQFEVLINKFNQVVSEMEWVAKMLKIKKHCQQMYALIRNKLRNYALNALEIAEIYREAKTKFVFDPEKGVIDFEQKLPMSWHAFNETPKFQDIAEYQLIKQVQNILSSNDTSILKHIYDFRSYLDPKTWLLSHYSRAFLIDSRFYITFDKRLVTLNVDPQETTNCTYLLSHEFWKNTFSLSVAFLSTSKNNMVSGTKYTLIANGHTFEISLKSDALTIDGIANPWLPVKLDNILVQRDSNTLLINSVDGYKMECNMRFDMCWFEISGQYFGRTAGLLGTMNNEPFDDFVTPSNTIAKSNNIFTDAWNSNICNKKREAKLSTVKFSEPFEICHQLFASLTLCTDLVDPEHFITMCTELGYKSNEGNSGPSSLKGYCTAALAYIEICRLAKIPVRVPQQCIFCEISNGTFVPESTFLEYNPYSEPYSSDIVFVVEANMCNSYTTKDKIIDHILTALVEQLDDHKFINNRYAVVAFGGQSPPFDYPRSISNEYGVFVNSTDILRRYFNHVTSFLNSDNYHKSNSDILQAISIASRLNFRPGVSKTFILLSCNRCDIKQTLFDYSSISHYMNEEGIRLHILTDTDFTFDKQHKMRKIFGFDKHFVYSHRFPEGEGESETRHILHISRSGLGICTPLALETGGSIFSRKKIMTEWKNSFRRFATIFAKRVVQGAMPIDNQTCECTGHKTGVAYMLCTQSEFPSYKLLLEENDSDLSGMDWQFEMDDIE